MDDIEAMIEGKNVTEWKEETKNRGSPEFAKAAALIDQVKKQVIYKYHMISQGVVLGC